jgi:hypothetical protein
MRMIMWDINQDELPELTFDCEVDFCFTVGWYCELGILCGDAPV